MTDAAPVVARGLVKRYGDIVAVAGVDLTVEPGDVFGYLGPNGAGKTTSLRMMLGLIRPTAGAPSSSAATRSSTALRALEGVAGFVEGPRFYPYLSGRRNLQLLADYDEPSSRSRIEEVLETVELRDRAKDRVGGYSHGMRQRLGIARLAPAPAAAPAARRAGDRARPGRHARHARPHPAARRRRDHDPALEPSAVRGRGALQPRRDHPPTARSCTRDSWATCSRPRRPATG